MKRLILFAGLNLLSFATFSQLKLQKVWETGSGLKTPESALYDPKKDIIYISNIGNDQQPESGFISQLQKDGKIRKLDWVTGLTAVKGLGLYKNLLYAAETKSVVVIDVEKAGIVQRIPVDSAQFLNDITIDDRGVVYVSDTRKNKIHQIADGKVTVYLENMKSVNGLLAKGTDLYILSDGSLYKADKNKQIQKLAGDMEKSTDGIVMLMPGKFIVTSWIGTIYYVAANAPVQLLSDTRAEKINTADLGYNPKDKIIYVPTFFNNTVIAYKID
ncbi:SMP-30/gluconolactonase/LRE family protein [Chitinophaga rhizophila]|uniref:ATP/GTP-binding protein n=1 Tax=Chitinophaga rhizophila TaxID=2866212 RepID=A0ABS7GM61_9BACT|nr:ATP/GTP-binding protein [Chitinophaga rhizophila]MBW8687974.1 ATP/GTP-binding protein [Chitinophaga rhizophila]